VDVAPRAPAHRQGLNHQNDRTDPSPIPPASTDMESHPAGLDAEETGEMPNYIVSSNAQREPGPLGPVARIKSRAMMPEIERARMTVRPGPVAPSTRAKVPVAPSTRPRLDPPSVRSAPPTSQNSPTPPMGQPQPSHAAADTTTNGVVDRTAAFRPSVSDLHDFDDFEDTGDVEVDINAHATIAVQSVELPERTDMFEAERTAAIAAADVAADLDLDGFGDRSHGDAIDRFQESEDQNEATMAMKALDLTQMSSDANPPWNQDSPPPPEDATVSFTHQRFDDEDTDAGPMPRLARIPADTTVFEQHPAGMSNEEEDDGDLEVLEPQGRTRAYNADELRKLKKLFDSRR
ncbi:MAG: hypothetical protein AAFV29_07230, partial [Myxococcota bacterium]